jgi:tRNA nucleotidyltransferase/poly(A) polymerase
MLSKAHESLFTKTLALADAGQFPVYVAGGLVRDLLLGNSRGEKDVDFVVEGDAPKLAERAAEAWGGKLQVFSKFLTAKVQDLSVFEGIAEVDFATARTETYPAPGALPVVAPATIEADLRRRDFSINAMAVKVSDLLAWLRAPAPTVQTLAPLVLDYFQGRNDLERKAIRILHDNSFRDDPTRIFRACRYAARLNGGFEPHTATLLKEAVMDELLETISPFRKLTEVRKIFKESAPSGAFSLLNSSGVFAHFSLFEPAVAQSVLRSLARLEQLVPKANSEMRYEAALRLFYYSWIPSAGETLFRSYGFGKKFLKAAEVERTLPPSLDTCSTEGLIVHAVHEGTDGTHVAQELKKRLK